MWYVLFYFIDFTKILWNDRIIFCEYNLSTVFVFKICGLKIYKYFNEKDNSKNWLELKREMNLNHEKYVLKDSNIVNQPRQRIILKYKEPL